MATVPGGHSVNLGGGFGKIAEVFRLLLPWLVFPPRLENGKPHMEIPSGVKDGAGYPINILIS